MSFMNREVTTNQLWILIDGTNGTTFVPADMAPEVARAINLGLVWMSERRANKYYDGVVYATELIEGYGARLSAPGYLDCTEWNVFDTQQAAEEYLRDEYPEDSEDGDEDEV